MQGAIPFEHDAYCYVVPEPALAAFVSAYVTLIEGLTESEMLDILEMATKAYQDRRERDKTLDAISRANDK